MALVLKILKNWTTNYGDTFTCQTQSQMTFCSRTNGSDTHLRRYVKKELEYVYVYADDEFIQSCTLRTNDELKKNKK